MANPAGGMGFKGYLQLGRESAYGTAVAATHKLDLMEEDLHIVQNVIRDESLWGKMSRQVLYQGGFHYEGKIKVRCQYEGLAMLLDWVFGTGTYGAVGGTDTGPVSGIYIHTFVEREFLNSYTLEIIKGDIPAGKCFQVQGAVCTGITISGGGSEGNQLLVVELDIIAQDMPSNQTPTGSLKTPEISLTEYTPVLFYQMVGANSFDGTGETGANIRIKEFSLSYSNNATKAHYLGSQKIDQPVRGGFIDAKWKLTQEFRTKTEWEAARALTGSTSAVGLEFDDTRSPAVRKLILTSTTAKLIEYSPPNNKYGIIEATADWEAYYNGTDLGSLAAYLSNTKATVSTAYA